MSAASKESDEECETAGTSSMMESTMMEGEEYYHPETTVAWTEKARGSDQLCRICANANEYLIPIFSGEGAEHQLGMKIDKHLPIQVVKQDKLPLHVCYQCASTLIAWHDLHMGCVEAEKKLRQMFPECEEEVEHDSDDDDKADDFYSEPMESEMTEDPLEPSTSAASKPNRPSRSPRKKTVTKAKPKLKLTLVKTPVAILPKGAPKLLQPKEEQTDPDPASERFPRNTSFSAFQSALRVKSLHVLQTVPPVEADMEPDPSLVAPETVADDVGSWSERETASGSEESDASTEKKPLQTSVGRKAMSRRGQYVCSICVMSFSRNSDLLKHMRTHSPEMDYSLHSLDAGDVKPESKDAEFAGEALQARVARPPRKKKVKCVYHCSTCGKNFTLKDSFFRHMRIHSGEKPFTCHVCGKQFRDSGGLARHLKDVHAGIKNFVCDVCGRSFASKATREDHRRTHTGERPYVCHACGKTFKSKASLYTHAMIHTDLFAHPCTHCAKKFRRRQELLAHETTHTGEKPHACDVCLKTFRVRGELLRHKLVHSDAKPYVCAECGLTFRQKRYLKNHEKNRHEGGGSQEAV